MRIRIMTWNIHHGEGGDEKIDLERIASTILQWDPDLVALQEVDAGTARSGGVDQAAELARLTQREVRFASAMEWGGGQYGLAILGPPAIGDVRVLRLPNEEDMEPRIAAALEWEMTPGRFVRVVNTHLTSSGDSLRLRQCEALTGEFSEGDLPTVLLGDLNAEPGSLELQELGAWLDFGPEEGGEPTVPAGDPVRRIDFVGTDRVHGWVLMERQVPDEPTASDHRPVVVDLELPTAHSPGAAGDLR